MFGRRSTAAFSRRSSAAGQDGVRSSAMSADVSVLEAAFDGQISGPGGIAAFFELADRVRPSLDDRGLYLLHKGSARAYGILGEVERARDEARRALELVPDDDYCTRLLASLDLEGGAPVFVCLRRAQDLLHRGDALTGFALQSLAECNAMLGRFEEAGAYVAEHEAHMPLRTELRPRLELMVGDAVAAEDSARAVVEAQEAAGGPGDAAGSLAVLARAVLMQDKDPSELLGKLEDWLAPEDVRGQAQLRALRGRAAGDEALAREAVGLLEPTEYLNARAEVLLDFFAVSGEGADRAAALYEQKGNEFGARLARELLERRH